MKTLFRIHLFDKNESITKHYAVNFESIEEKFTNNLANANLEDYHKLFTLMLLYSPKIFYPIISH